MSQYLKLYTAVIFLSIIALCIMSVSVGINSIFSKKRKVFGILFIVNIILCSIGEWGGVVIEEYFHDSAIWLHILVKMMELSLAPYIGFLPIQMMRSSKVNLLDKVLFGILGLNVILEIASGFGGFIYNVDENNHYSHGTFYFLYLTSYICSMVYFVFMICIICKNQNRFYRIPILLTVAFVMASVVLQLLYSDIKVDWLAIGFAAILLFKLQGDMLVMSDGLTGLLNRHAFDNSIRNINYEAVIIFVDINHFKQINDQYGHLFGDECLTNVSRCLKKAYAKHGRIYRYGGDEFCIIIKKSVDRIDSMNNLFTSLIEESRLNNQAYPGVALGFANFDPKVDEILDVLEKADQSMYRNKESY
jgi:diguanylate cyclase (GGDEF)-like protein